MSEHSDSRLSLARKAGLATHIWTLFVIVRLGLRRRALPDLVERMGRRRVDGRSRLAPDRLGRAVDRTLRIGSRRPTCLVSSLVLLRLLREQGDQAELVIGLPTSSAGKDAHAWIEVGGRDVGPPPGGSGHAELARYS